VPPALVALDAPLLAAVFAIKIVAISAIFTRAKGYFGFKKQKKAC
jgi:hypothetical protein